MQAFPPGTPVWGVVTSCRVFGVFVRLDALPEVPALLELIHFAACETSLPASQGGGADATTERSRRSRRLTSAP
jgi:hypothetical protein